MTKLLQIAFLGTLLGFASCNNPCRKLDCENDGFCHEGICICQKWYSGETCELKFNRNYEGAYYGKYEVEEPVVYRVLDSLHLTAMDQANGLLSNLGFYLELEGDTTLIIPEQNYDLDSISYEAVGTGFYATNWISITLERTNLMNGVTELIRFEGERIEKAERD